MKINTSTQLSIDPERTSAFNSRKVEWVKFIKMVASGNDFVILDFRRKSVDLNLNQTAKQLCNRKLGIGADGILVLEKSKKADTKMRIFNADGSEAEMCGNGARCVAYFISTHKKDASQIKIETKAGILNGKVINDNVRINFTEPNNIKLNFIIKLNRYPLRMNFINTGVPHAVILCEKIEQIDVFNLGRLIRYHRKFKPAGTNVDFIEPEGLDRIKARTYERGVEEETLACGTGAVASSIIYSLKLKEMGLVKEDKICVNVDTVSGETLKVSFNLFKNKITNVWLEGKARIVSEGRYRV